MKEIAWFVGVDWASRSHRVCLLDAAGRRVAERDVPHGGRELAALSEWLLEKTGDRPEQIALAIETPRGPIVESLLERGFAVHAINPKQLDRFRDRFTVAGAKDDSRDARVLGDALRTDRHAFRRLRVEDPLVIELREWSRMAEDLQQERTRLINRIREQLWRYYPQALELEADLGAPWFLALWRQAPTPAKAARLRVGTVGKLLKKHRIRRWQADEVLRVLRQEPLRVAEGTAAAATAHIATVAARLELVNRQLAEAQQRLDALCAKLTEAQEGAPGQRLEQRDGEILRSMTGVGRIVLATLLSEANEALRERDYNALRSLSGVAPVTRRSGKSCIVVRRLACDRRLQQAVYHWARVAMQRDPVSRERYVALRQRGHTHGRALRTVGDRLLRVLCTLLERQELYDPHHRETQAAAA